MPFGDDHGQQRADVNITKQTNDFRAADGVADAAFVSSNDLEQGLTLVSALAFAAHCYVRRRRVRRQTCKRESNRLRYVTNHMPATAVSLADGLKYHLFLSHVWGLGQDRMRVVKDRLQVLLPGISVFLDVDDLEAGGGALDVLLSSRVLCYLTEEYFASKSCMKEVLWATCMRLPIVLLVNTDKSQGGLSLDDARRLLAKAHARFGDEWGLNGELEAWIDDQRAAVERQSLRLSRSRDAQPELTTSSSPLGRRAGTVRPASMSGSSGVASNTSKANSKGLQEAEARVALPMRVRRLLFELRVPTLAEIDAALLGGNQPIEQMLAERLFEWSPLRAFQDVMLRTLCQPFVRPRSLRRHPTASSRSLISRVRRASASARCSPIVRPRGEDMWRSCAGRPLRSSRALPPSAARSAPVGLGG